jgi:hypothetical protein
MVEAPPVEAVAWVIRGGVGAPSSEDAESEAGEGISEGVPGVPSQAAASTASSERMSSNSIGEM